MPDTIVIIVIIVSILLCFCSIIGGVFLLKIVQIAKTERDQKPIYNSKPPESQAVGPVNCKLSEWSDYGGCSATQCGTSGTKSRTRNIITPESNGGSCSALSESISCYAPSCASSISPPIASPTTSPNPIAAPIKFGVGKCVTDTPTRILPGEGGVTDWATCYAKAKAIAAKQYGLEYSQTQGQGECWFGTLPSDYPLATNCKTYQNDARIYGSDWSLGVYNVDGSNLEDPVTDKFKFYQGKDSVGNDLTKVQILVDKVPELKNWCLGNRNCKGFNTNAMMKLSILPEDKWTTWTTDSNKGLYVKQ